MTDLYAVLGLERDATDAEIRTAYRRLAKGNHPDRVGGEGHERMAAVNDAYAVLGDPERRRRYDESGSTDQVGRLRERAEERVRAMFAEYLTSDEEFRGDMVAGFRAVLCREIADGSSAIGAAAHKVRRLTARRNRIKSRLYTDLADHMIREERRHIGKLEEEAAERREAIDVLDELEDLWRDLPAGAESMLLRIA